MGERILCPRCGNYVCTMTHAELETEMSCTNSRCRSVLIIKKPEVPFAVKAGEPFADKAWGRKPKQA